MQINGERVLPLPRGEVWQGLNDPDILKASVPGCEQIDKVADNEYKMVIMLAIGPVKARFNGKLTLSDIDPETSYSLAVEGNAGAAGFAKGTAKVSIATVDAGTRLNYDADAQVGGKLAQVGSRLIEGVAAKMAAEFFSRFQAAMLVGKEPAPAPAQKAPSARAMQTATPDKKFPRGWVIAAAAALAIAGFCLNYF